MLRATPDDQRAVCFAFPQFLFRGGLPRHVRTYVRTRVVGREAKTLTANSQLFFFFFKENAVVMIFIQADGGSCVPVLQYARVRTQARTPLYVP